jgi:hypothetical protein
VNDCKIQVLTQSESHDVNFEHPIESVTFNGEKLSDIHDLTQKVIAMTKTIKVLAITALTLCVLAVGMALFTTHWLLSHESSIEQLLLTGNEGYDKQVYDAANWNSHRRQRAFVHLEEFYGLHWDEGMQDWVNHAIVRANKRN